MSSIGYARVSTRDQHAQGQIDALERAGCAKVFTDTASGKLATRPQLDAVMAYLREGEDTLVITRLDRLGRSVINLKTIAGTLAERGIALRVIEQDIDTATASGRMFFTIMASVAEFERDLIVERTHEGLAAARARGRVGGRRPKMTPTKIKAARAMYDSREHTIAEIAHTFSVTSSTIYRHLDPDRPKPALKDATETGPRRS